MILCMICHENKKGGFVGHGWERPGNSDSHYFCMECAAKAWSKNTTFMKPNVCLVCTSQMDTEDRFKCFVESVFEEKQNNENPEELGESNIDFVKCVVMFVFLLLVSLGVVLFYVIEHKTSYALDQEGNLYLRILLTDKNRKIFHPFFFNETETGVMECVQNTTGFLNAKVFWFVDGFIELVQNVISDLFGVKEMTMMVEDLKKAAKNIKLEMIMMAEDFKKSIESIK